MTSSADIMFKATWNVKNFNVWYLNILFELKHIFAWIFVAYIGHY